MTKIGRNDICPCGSGKKYKKCCMVAAEAAAQKDREHQAAVPRVLDWLSTHYERELIEAVDEDFLGWLDDDELDRLGDLGDDLLGMVDINIGEWSIADAQIVVKGKRTPVRDLIFGVAGPVLAVSARDWLQRLVERPMSIYEARRVEPGKGVEVADVLRPDEPVAWVVERSASQSLVRWDTFGARLVRKDGGWVFSGALYPLPRDVTAECGEEIQREMEGVEWDSETGREVVSAIIIDYWLHELVAERRLPQLVDASTKEPIALVTEHYKVTDWSALEAALEAQPDVEGDRENGWVRFVSLEDEMRRSQASLNVTGPDLLNVLCRTLKLADETRAWLEDIAGQALKHRAREVVDPRSPKAMASAGNQRPAEIPPELQSQLVREMLMKHYESWPDIEVPALGGKTPRQAVTTPEGRRAVVELLKEFDQQEARRAADQGGEPFDFGFLWQSLGLMGERK